MNEVRVSQHDDYLRNIELWNMMINVYSINGNAEEMKRFYQKMKTIDSLIMNVQSYKYLINGLSEISNGYMGE